MIAIRRMKDSELGRIAEIDRSEHITKIYKNEDGTLVPHEVDIEALPWFTDGRREHSVQAMVEECQAALDRDGVMFGAFDGDVLVGFAIYCPHLSEETAQLADLYVSRGHRNQGIGALLTETMTELARADGARKLYVSATSTASTVHFYMGQGFELTREVNQRLYELEPDDIHMIKVL
jgi:ribosomal protein S18 acetylase RimI-like enzyme